MSPFPPVGERRRRPRWEITAAQLYSGHGQACLQGKQRCACKDHNHSTLDRVSALMAAAQICFDVVFWVCNLRAISSWHAKECFLFNHDAKVGASHQIRTDSKQSYFILKSHQFKFCHISVSCITICIAHLFIFIFNKLCGAKQIMFTF